MKGTIKKILRRSIVNNRDGMWGKTIIKLAEFARKSYYNSNWEFTENGERLVLARSYEYFSKSPDSEFCVFDVGANEGQWLEVAYQTCPGAHFHVFEIVPATFQELHERFHAFDNVSLNDFGLSNEKTEVELFHYPSSTTGSSMYDYAWQIQTVTVNGKVETGDEYCQTKNIDRIHFLKIDTEGAEGLVLKGFEKSMQNVDVVQFEYSSIVLITKYFLKDFYEYFESKGFVIGRVYPNYVDFKEYDVRIDENLVDGNFLAVNKKHQGLIQKLGK